MENKYLNEILTSLPDKPLLRVDEIMPFLNCSKMTVYRLYENNELKGTRINGSIRIYRQSIIEMIKNGDGKTITDETDEEVERKVTAVMKKTRKQLSKGI